MALAIGAIGNEGVMMRPNIVQEIRSPRGVATFTAIPSALSRVTDPSYARTLTEYLVDTVNEGGAATVSGVDVAGKTGSAENISGYSHAWFVGFAPAQNPRIALAIVLEEEGQTGAAGAAPLARRIFQHMLDE
jgi:peptidoglycan glycosyltransferase